MVLFFFFLGLIFGSFVNVVVDRLSVGKSIGGRSCCDFCQRALEPRDLAPLLSFIFLRGRCRFCYHKLSWQYPLIEVLTGGLFAAVYFFSLKFFSSEAFPFFAAISLIFWLVFLTDLKYGLIPTALVGLGVLVALANYIFNIIYNGYKLYGFLSAGGLGDYLLQTDFLRNRLILLNRPLFFGLVAGLTLAAFFAFLVWVTRGRGMGGGDVRFGFLMGLVLGPAATLVAVFFSFLTGSLAAITLMAVGRKKFGQTIPFGPFLAASSLVSLFFGQQIWNTYLNVLR